MQQLAALFDNWWRKPFNPEGDAINWALFVGFVLVVMFLWRRVLKQIIPSE
jgi:hypothetical protein